VKLLHAADVGGSGWLFDEMITWTAARIEPIPSVPMNEFTRSRTTTRALMTPISIPTPIATSTAGTTAKWCWLISTTARIPVTLAVAPTERS
jgi:hypothetical protein